jgi:2-oxoglutarate dehydrogenase complex dehydrogenase (E1) component-like enzyme
VEEMYEAWAYDPKSVHASWDAYFRGGAYQAPPSLGSGTRPNEVSLASMMPGLMGSQGSAVAGGGQASSTVIDAHLAVQGTIRYIKMVSLSFTCSNL